MKNILFLLCFLLLAAVIPHAQPPTRPFGVPCVGPSTGDGVGVIIYAKLPDGSCLNLVAVPNSLFASQGKFTGYDQLMLVHIGPSDVVQPVIGLKAVPQ